MRSDTPQRVVDSAQEEDALLHSSSGAEDVDDDALQPPHTQALWSGTALLRASCSAVGWAAIGALLMWLALPHLSGPLSSSSWPFELLSGGLSPFNPQPLPVSPLAADAPVLVNFTASQAAVCMDAVRGNGSILLLGNSIMRGLFSFLNQLVNDWPPLTRDQQKALCEADAVSGTFGHNCKFEQFKQRVPVYYDLMQDYCDAPAIGKLTSDPRYSVIWNMVGTHPVSTKTGAWHGEALNATRCIPDSWGPWAAQSGHLLLHSTPPKPCPRVTIWKSPAGEFLGQLHDAVYVYVLPAFREAGARVVDYLNLTSTAGPLDCRHYGRDAIHPVNLYPALLNLWLNQLCLGVELPRPKRGEAHLGEMLFNQSVAEAPGKFRDMPA